MRSCVAVFALALALAAAPASAAQPPSPPGEAAFLGCKKYPPDKKFRWSVRGEVGVRELAASLGEISCRPIVLATAVADRSGKVILDVPDLVTAAEVYRLFYGALDAMGLTVDAENGALKVVDSARAKEIATPALDGAVPSDDRFVVRLYHPRHAQAQELADVTGKLRSKEGEVSLFSGNTVLMIDRASAVRRMEALLHALDVGEAGARVFTLATHAQAPADLAATLEKILGAAARRPAAADKGAKPAMLDGDLVALVPLEAARLVAVVGNDAGWARVQAIAARIDPPLDESAASQGHVLYLANTNAEELAATLATVGLGSRSAVATARPGGAPGASSPSSLSSTSSAALPLSGEVRVGADKVANALVVFANAADFATVQELVKKLDVPRRQVYVEAVILDLTVDKARTLGISWHQGASNGSVSGVVGNESASLLSFDAKSVAAAAAGGGLFAGVFGSSFSLLGQDIPSFGVMLQALETQKDANVISRPHLLTMDNVKATLSVGQVLYVPTSSLGALTSGSTPSLLQNYSPTEVQLKLDLTPHLNESASVRLEIAGEISDIAEVSASGRPTTNKRTVNTAVVVRDGESIVLGGLTKETDTQSVEKIPFLGDIPLFGKLFQTKRKQRVKQDLLIVLTPYIIRGPEDLRRIAERKEEERREFIERFSAFHDEGQFEARVDYKRKRGLLEEINLVAASASREAEAVRDAERTLKPKRQDGPITLEPQ